MTALIWATALVLIVVTIMAGVIIVARSTGELADNLRRVNRERDETIIRNQKLDDEVRRLRMELMTEKNRKVHDADAS